MRTTIELHDQLLEEARRTALRRDLAGAGWERIAAAFDDRSGH